MGVSPSVLAHRASQKADHQRLFTLLPSVGLAHTQPLSEEVLQQWPAHGLWSDAQTYANITELLSECLAQQCSSEYLLHYLQKAGDEGRTFNLYVEGHRLSDSQLLSLLPYLAITAQDQPVLRVLLTLSREQLANPTLAPLTQRLLACTTERSRRGMALPFIYALLGIGTAVALFWWARPIWMPVLSPVVNAVPPTQLHVSSPVVEKNHLPTEAAVTLAVSEVTESLATQKRAVAAEDEAVIKQFIEQWRTAWETKSADAYLAFYHADYSGYAHLSPAQWQQNRRDKFADVQQIGLALGPIRLWQEGRAIHARFWQLYRSPGYRDNTDKELVLLPTAQGWQIVDEINHEVIPLSAAED